MEIVEITKEQLISFLTDEKRIVNSGSNGILSIYNENSLIKIHQKEVLNSYISNDFDEYLDEEIDSKLSFEKEVQSCGLNKFSLLKEKINRLSQTSSNLIEGIVLYRSYPIGVLIKSYVDYSNLVDVFLKLDENQKIFIIDRIKALYWDLMNHDIYPTDIKIDNILVKIENLDVKIIDLDGYDTVVGNRCHSKEHSLVSLEKLLKRLSDYLVTGKNK